MLYIDFLSSFSRKGAKTQSKTFGAGGLPLRLCAFAREIFVIILLLAFPSFAHAQEDEVVKVKSNLVNIDVIVKDKKGKYISDLKAEDFVVTENGQPQKVEFFDAPLSGSTEAHKAVAAGGVETTAAPPTTAPRNYVSLVLDFQTTDVTNLKPVREGAIKYVRERVTDADAVALLTVTHGLRMVQTFTQDKPRLIAALENLGASADSKNFEQRDIAENISNLRDFLNSAPPGGNITTNAGGSAQARVMIAQRVLAQFIQLRTALSLQQARPVLAALAALAEGLRPIPGKKTVVLFSQGFVTPAVLDWQVQSTIDIANRANVAIYIIDSAGLRASAPTNGSYIPSTPLGGISAATSQEQRIKAVGGETVFDTARQEGQTREYDILYRLSGDTGGKFLKGNNDIGLGLERINEEIQARYTIAYRSTNQNFDGSFRKVKIEVRRPDVQIMSRNGYYAIPPEEIVLLSPADKKLLASFNEAQASPGLPLFVSLTPFRTREGLYTVPLAIELPPAAVKFESKGDKRSMQLEVLGVLKTGSERIVSRLGGNFDVNLNAADYDQILNNNIFYRQDLQLASGEYTIDLIVKDKQTGKMAAHREQFVLPEPEAEFAATPVALSRYVEPASQLAPDPAEFPDVFVYGKQLIRPSAARQFKATDNLIMYLAVYNAANSPDTGKPLVRVTVRLMKDGQPATKFFDFVLTDIQERPVPHLTFAEYLRLANLAPGRYQAMIEVKDMVTRKSSKQEAPFDIVP
ncbi:MAG TPA: VWA domain-containing protein [Pyrinomonadaceae bacterium]|nr:VWA domain-containing protein [Pyrinomonadaceae bacterium]